MSRKPQFEHKIPRFSENLEGLESALRQRPAPSYNAAIVACVYVAGWNGRSILGLMERSTRGAARPGGLDGARVRQMEILR
jgi:hypothetical protein